MNLIEQLGGYERAKDGFNRLKLEQKDLLTCGSIVVVECQLNEALLQYRREHGIYEAGDCVIVDGHEDVYQIQYVYEGACGYGMWQGRRFSHSMIERHATDAEIKANKRLEVA